ncbi:hypothetical protein ACLM5H_00720 [Fredinandcohnia humi]
MNAFPNFSEFYQKPLIPIGQSDLLTLSDLPFATHWLIAMEGVESGQDNRIAHWKVLVFASNVEGFFDYQKPHYLSHPITSIHDALTFAKELEGKCMCDQFNLHTSSKEIV